MASLVALKKVLPTEILVQDDPQQVGQVYPPTKHFTNYTVLIA